MRLKFWHQYRSIITLFKIFISILFIAFDDMKSAPFVDEIHRAVEYLKLATRNATDVCDGKNRSAVYTWCSFRSSKLISTCLCYREINPKPLRFPCLLKINNAEMFSYHWNFSWSCFHFFALLRNSQFLLHCFPYEIQARQGNRTHHPSVHPHSLYFVAKLT